MNVAAQLADRACDMPHRLAIVDRTARVPRSLTFAELDAAASRAAHVFSASGLAPGARVAVLHPMSAQLYIALAGLLRAGLVPVVCDPAAGRAHVRRCIAAVRPAALFASLTAFAYAATVPELTRIPLRFGARRFPGVQSIAGHDACGACAIAGRSDGTASAIADRAPNDAALITFTSGSTGTPKVVVRSHAVLRAQLDALRPVLAHGHIDVATMPIVLLANLACGITSMIPSVRLRRPGTVDPDRLAADIAATHASSIIASPALLARLAYTRDRTQLSGLQRIVTGGAPVMPALLDTLHALVPAAELIALYGSTEAEPIAHLAYADITPADRRALAGGAGLLAGRVVAETALRIIAPRWGTPLRTAVALPAETIGEIVVAGTHVVAGYLDAAGDAETKIHDGNCVWHRTGDLGYIDRDGRLWLMGRASAVVDDRRGTAHPLAVECALSTVGAIERSALIGIGGRRVVAVECRPYARIDREELLRTLAFAHVDEIRTLRTIPVDARHNAKVDYPALQRRLGVTT